MASAGKFQSTPEISFHVKDKSVAIKKAKKYDQIGIWDWKNDSTIETGGTGKRSILEGYVRENMNKVEKYKSIDNEKHSRKEREDLLKTMTNEEIDELIKLMPIVQGKIYVSKFKKK